MRKPAFCIWEKKDAVQLCTTFESCIGIMFCLCDILLNNYSIKLRSYLHGQLFLPHFSWAGLTEEVNLYSVLTLSPATDD